MMYLLQENITFMKQTSLLLIDKDLPLRECKNLLLVKTKED